MTTLKNALAPPAAASLMNFRFRSSKSFRLPASLDMSWPNSNRSTEPTARPASFSVRKSSAGALCAKSMTSKPVCFDHFESFDKSFCHSTPARRKPIGKLPVRVAMPRHVGEVRATVKRARAAVHLRRGRAGEAFERGGASRGGAANCVGQVLLRRGGVVVGEAAGFQVVQRRFIQ